MIDKYRVNMRAGQENIIFDHDSILRDSTIDRTTFQPTVIPDNLTISQISQVSPEQIITSLKAKLVALKPTKRFQTAKGHFTKYNKKRSHTQLDSRKQVIAFQDRVMTINIKEAQHPLKREKQIIDKSSIMLKISTKSMHRVLV